MSLVFAGVLPNAPMNDPASSQATDAIHELEGELYCMKPDTIIVLAPNGTDVPHIFQATIAATIHDNEKQEWKTDIGFIVHLKEVLDSKQQSLFGMSANETLDDSVATPLKMLTAHLPDASIVIITTPHLPVETQYVFGGYVRHEVQLTNKRIAVIATGALQSDELALNTTIGTCIDQSNSAALKTMRHELTEHSRSTLLDPLTTLFGIVEGMACHMQRLGAPSLPPHLLIAQIVLQ